MIAEMEKTLANLKANNFDARFAQSGTAAKEIILSSTPGNALVGAADSATIRQIGVVDALRRKGIKVLDPFSRELTTDPAKTAVRDNISRQLFSCDVLLVGTNAVTMDGKLVNIDGVGNRVAAMIFGPTKVFIVVGRNKIVKDVDEALHRIKNVIAPVHAKTKEFVTPCAQTGRCSDCSAPKRICNVVTIMEKRPWRTGTSVILIDEDLGLGWDQAWQQKRIQQIRSNYERVTWQ